MSGNSEAKQVQERVMAVYRARPSQALSTVTGKAQLRGGLACAYEQDGQRVVTDMPIAIGGTGTGPTPGFYGRAALCSCVAMGVQMTAVRDGVRIDAVTVTIEQDWDDRGLFEMAGAPAGPLATRIAIELESSESPERIADVISRALAHDPWLLAYQDAQWVETTFNLVQLVS